MRIEQESLVRSRLLVFEFRNVIRHEWNSKLAVFPKSGYGCFIWMDNCDDVECDPHSILPGASEARGREVRTAESFEVASTSSLRVEAREGICTQWASLGCFGAAALAGDL